jgi:hypothetical protein
VKKLEKTHMEHIAQYGANNEQRLTGKHETADMNTFGYAFNGEVMHLHCLCILLCFWQNGISADSSLLEALVWCV